MFGDQSAKRRLRGPLSPTVIPIVAKERVNPTASSVKRTDSLHSVSAPIEANTGKSMNGGIRVKAGKSVLDEAAHAKVR